MPNLVFGRAKYGHVGCPWKDLAKYSHIKFLNPIPSHPMVHIHILVLENICPWRGRGKREEKVGESLRRNIFGQIIRRRSFKFWGNFEFISCPILFTLATDGLVHKLMLWRLDWCDSCYWGFQLIVLMLLLRLILMLGKASLQYPSNMSEFCTWYGPSMQEDNTGILVWAHGDQLMFT